MLNLVLDYHPGGDAVGDFYCERWLVGQLNAHAHLPSGSTLTLQVSTENVIQVARCLKREGTITGDLILDFRDGQRYVFDCHGKLDEWPTSYPDYQSKWLERLI